MTFTSRADAGRQLASALSRHRGGNCAIYALPRGGVIVGAEVAKALEAPLDVIIVRKIGHPASPEYAIGAVSDDGELILNSAETGAIDERWLGRAIERERDEAARRRRLYTAGRAPLQPKDRTAIVVDDGLATGFTMEVALRQLRKKEPAHLVMAVPVAPPDTVDRLRPLVDEAVVLREPRPLFAIGAFYDDFTQVTDAEVVAVLRQFAKARKAG